jgi:GAF domain-containing protein
MSEPLIAKGDYSLLIPQIEALISGEQDLIANLANAVAALHTAFPFLWTGFYIVKGNELVLGPFQGPVACTRIAFGRGVCGTAWSQEKTIIVPDVEKFPDHIACSSESKSEIVVPIMVKAKVVAVLDVDSKAYNAFNENDAECLEKVAKILSEIWID